MDISLSGKLSSLSLISQKKLEKILSTCGSKKDLIIEPALIDPLERVCAASWLRQRGIDKIFKLEAKLNASANASRVYMIPSCLIKLKNVLDQINEVITQANTAEKRNITIIIIPKVLAIHEFLLEEEGLAGIVNLISYQWEMIRMDQNVLSLEFASIFKSVFVNKDSSLLSSISNSLWTLFHVIGVPPLFVSIGKQSHSIIEMYDVFSETFNKTGTTKDDNDVGALIIVDRDQDYASSLLTPATYSSLLYEIFNIKCGKLDLDTNNTRLKHGQLDLNLPCEKKEEKTKTKTYMMLDGESDPLYSEIRYRHFSTVFSVLNAKVKALNTDSGSVSNLGLDQMKQYVSTKLQQVLHSKRILANHILACETIIASLGDKFEDLQNAEKSMLYSKSKLYSNVSNVETTFCTDSNMYSSLKLLCLLSLTRGISYEEYTSLITKYLHTFGYKFLYVFHNLCNAGLLITPNENKLQIGLPSLSTLSDRLPLWQNNNFQTIANKLKQLPNVDDVDVKDPLCPSYVFNGSYIPLVAALAKILLTSENINDLLSKLVNITEVKLGGPIFDGCKKTVDDLGEKLSELKVDEASVPNDLDVACKDIKTATEYLKGDSAKVMPLRPKHLLIFIVGGATQAEIAACHLVEKLTGGRIIVASDSLISGDHLVKAAM